jgi:hypothetical protein
MLIGLSITAILPGLVVKVLKKRRDRVEAGEEVLDGSRMLIVSKSVT